MSFDGNNTVNICCISVVVTEICVFKASFKRCGLEKCTYVTWLIPVYRVSEMAHDVRLTDLPMYWLISVGHLFS